MSLFDKKRVNRLRNAIYEANRFIQKAELAANQIEDGNFIIGAGHPEFAAAKRSSMDLTRSLAVLRRSLYDQ
jgi:hypothetical protein